VPKPFALALAALSLGSVLGCCETYRYVTAQHWHDRDTLVIAYTEYVRQHYVIASTGQSSTHVLLCRVASDNTLACRPQPEIDRAINCDQATAPAAKPPPAAGGP
jgi:hypothetical protein